MLTCPNPPPVTLVMDPYDDYLHTWAALDGHRPEQGQITVHPTPGTQSLACLAYDILAALGKPAPVSCYRQQDTDAPWTTAAAWILATDITHLTVLRAHLLSAARLQTLLDLRARTGVRLALVCHQRSAPAALERALRPVTHHRAQAAAVLPGPQETASELPEAPRPLAGRWLNLPALTTLSTLDLADRRCRCTAPTPAERGFYPPPLTALAAVEVAHRLHSTTAHPYLAAALATACFTAASTTQLATAHLSDLAPDAATITLHDCDGVRQGCMTHPVPDWARPLLLATAYLQRLTGTGLPLLDKDPLQGTGMPLLERFAEACKLRPPQPPRNRPRRGTSRRKQSPAETVWPWCTAHHHFRWAATEEMQGCPQPPSHTKPLRKPPAP
ncbi:hypothetical protein ACEZDB_11955 [Streptacidiphilus sp. N1-3]|uniref:Uncharacterized protein n=1 Tax=Streptacidiphilus alkalitolerans TaxID=3342712 RepID=A0ABV6WZ98_9ACTN